MAVLQLGLHLSPLSLNILKFSVQFFNLLLIFLTLDLLIGILNLLEFAFLKLEVLLLSQKLLCLLFGFNFHLIGVFSLFLDRFVHICGHELDFLLKHMDPLLSM
jgi:hypothetical protein